MSDQLPGKMSSPHTCDCGKLTTNTCGEIWPPVTLVLCTKPLCGTGCKVHRHEAGSMGYPGTMKGFARYQGDEPDDDGIWEWAKSRCRALFWGAPRKAQNTYDEICAAFPAPAPWPQLQLQIGRRLFESRGPLGMVEVKELSEPRARQVML